MHRTATILQTLHKVPLCQAHYRASCVRLEAHAWSYFCEEPDPAWARPQPRHSIHICRYSKGSGISICCYRSRSLTFLPIQANVPVTQAMWTQIFDPAGEWRPFIASLSQAHRRHLLAFSLTVRLGYPFINPFEDGCLLKFWLVFSVV